MKKYIVGWLLGISILFFLAFMVGKADASTVTTNTIPVTATCTWYTAWNDPGAGGTSTVVWVEGITNEMFAGIYRGIDNVWGTTNYVIYGWRKYDLAEPINPYTDISFSGSNTDAVRWVEMEIGYGSVVVTNTSPPPPDGPPPIVPPGTP